MLDDGGKHKGLQCDPTKLATSADRESSPYIAQGRIVLLKFVGNLPGRQCAGVKPRFLS